MFKFVYQKVNEDGDVIEEKFYQTLKQITSDKNIPYHIVYKIYNNSYEGKRVHKSVINVIKNIRIIDNYKNPFETE
jgi:predicted DNA-binding ribbon-helix-helix protein